MPSDATFRGVLGALLIEGNDVEMSSEMSEEVVDINSEHWPHEEGTPNLSRLQSFLATSPKQNQTRSLGQSEALIIHAKYLRVTRGG